MIKCCICGNQLAGREAAVRFARSDGKEKEICTVCEQKMNIVMDGDKPAEIKDAVNYFNNYIPSVDDKEVVSFLEDAICFRDKESKGNSGQSERNEEWIKNIERWIKKLKKTSIIISALVIVTAVITGALCAVYVKESLGFAIIFGTGMVVAFFLTFIIIVSKFSHDIANSKKNEKDKKH